MPRNSVYLEGKPTKLAFRKVGDKGARVVNFTLAFYNGPASDAPGYVQVEFWNSTPEQRKALKKIDGEGRVAVSGFLKHNVWENDDGDKQYSMRIRADAVSIAFDPPERDDDEDDNRSRRNKKDKNTSSKKRNKKKTSKQRRREEEDDEDEDSDDDDDDDDNDDDDVPF